VEDAPQGLAGPFRAPLVPFPALQEAVFLARPNRFTARVRLAGREVAVFLPDSGRLPDLLVPGRRVFLRPAAGPGRRTGHDLLLVDHDGVLVSLDSRLPNLVFARALEAGLLPDLQGYAEVRREVGLPGGRLDFVLGGDGLAPCAVEVKSVTLVRKGVALFPDAPTARGRRHVLELLRLRREAGLTLAEAAEQVGVSASSVRKAEHGGRLRPEIRAKFERILREGYRRKGEQIDLFGVAEA